MPFPTAVAQDAASSESALNDLLSTGLETPEAQVTDVEETPSETPETETEVETEVATPEDAEATEAETEDVSETEEGEEEESGEEDFEAETLETDFSEATYAKAAAHWEKRGVTLDPNNDGQRAMLKDWLERGQKISELQSAQPTQEPVVEPAAAEATQKTPEQMLEERITGVKAYAKDSFNPHVARELVLPGLTAIANFFWGKDKGTAALANKSDAELAEVTQALTAMMGIQIADAVPQIVAATPHAVERAFPYMSKMHEMAEKEAAVDEILGATDKTGNAQFPGFDKLVDSGAINRALASPELKNAMFDRDPYKNRIAKLKFAYKLARNERVDPQALVNASRRGRAAEKERQQRVAAGRNASGNANRGTASAGSSFLNDLVGGGESRSASLFKNVGRRQS